MKKIILLFLSILLVTFYGCNKKDVDPVHYSYSIALTFENQSGDNLVTGIPYSEKEQRIPYSEYTRTAWAENGIELLTAELQTIKDENGEDAILLDGMTWEHVSPIITQKLVCPYIFGDNNEHVLVSYWEELPDSKHTCTGFTFDGKEYPISKDNITGIYRVKIVLD